MNEQIELIIPNNSDLLSVVINNANGIATLMGFEKTDIHKIELGVEEAVGNIIKFAFEDEEKENIRIVFSIEDLGLGVSIFEKGMPFDPSIVAEFSPEKFKEDLSDEGLGMYLLKKFMDEFSFINHGKDGKETRLFKYLHNKDVEEILDKEEKAKARQEREEEKLPKGSIKYKVRPLKPEEAVEVSRCAYTSYGYTYVHEAIYHPDRVRLMNENGDLISFVAVSDDGEVISHCALEREEDRPVPQIGVAATKPRFRGQGCLNELNIALIDEAKRRKFTGIYARCITTHIFSQKSMLKHNLMPCALLVSSGKERKYKGIEQKIIQRESVLLQFIYLNKPDEHFIFPPEKHKHFIGKIYDFINAKPEIREADKHSDLPEKPCVMSINTNINSLVADIYVKNYGKDLIRELAENLRKLCRDGIKSIYLHLRLADPYTAIMTEEIEEMGFFFAGIKPGSGNGDVIILQYQNNHGIDYEYVAIGCDESRQILEYVREHDPNYQNNNKF